VQEEGLEPPLSCENEILSLARLPVPPFLHFKTLPTRGSQNCSPAQPPTQCNPEFAKRAEGLAVSVLSALLLDFRCHSERSRGIPLRRRRPEQERFLDATRLVDLFGPAQAPAALDNNLREQLPPRNHTYLRTQLPEASAVVQASNQADMEAI
jgi:hypothetical protein